VRRLLRLFGRTVIVVLALILLGGSTLSFRGSAEELHRFTGPIEFDFVGWTLGAIGAKLRQDSAGETAYLTPPERESLVRSYIHLQGEADRLEAEIRGIYADPGQTDPESSASRQQSELATIRKEMAKLQPAVETVLQEQAAVTLDRSGLGSLGAPFPPVAFHLSQLPMALVISPRSTIRQDAMIELLPDLTIEQQVALEQEVEDTLGVSALVVPIGGIGTYPTMVQETTALDWLSEVVLHEWVHNYLFLRPLGWAYDSSPETRTMNETTASLVGKALGRSLLERYYPDLVPPPQPASPPPTPGGEEPPAFNFNAEMHTTRVEVDRLLAEGKVDEAEAYMEARRKLLVDHGYVIRRLNQAYFAFYGAYAEEPQGAAGADPVGEAVRTLWARSVSPAAFLKTMAGMTSFEDLKRVLGETVTTP
jgi:hypothetical protein